MPRWIERRGFTLRLPLDEGAYSKGSTTSIREGVVRLSLVERVGLVRGWYNVREARAEPHGEGFRALSDGRSLSWRWLRQIEADRLLEARLGTLQAMGYEVIDEGVAMRGRWDWLYDLVHTRLPRAEATEVEVWTGSTLEEALTRIGSSPDAVIEALATALRLSPHDLRHPDVQIVHRAAPAELGVLLPFLVHHEQPEIREIGQRWLGFRSAAYQLSRATLQDWLETDRQIAGVVGPRLQDEGLALLGPETLIRLSRTGCTNEIRDAAKRWGQRVG